MNPERWRQIKEVLATALETPIDEREQFLSQICREDPDLRREVEQLLESESKLHANFLDEQDLAQAAAEALPEEENPWIGRRVGAYEIVEQIGAGGMGEVYRAFRADDQYRKDVALKLIRTGQDSALVIRRFRNERQILAGLQHSNIAMLLDGGTTDSGTPYLVMELIEGQPIVEYCHEKGLSVSGKLQLFLQICSAVQYAHQHLIIHRDIKPSNILVTSDGSPKLLDFGIAKILDTQSGSTQPDPTLTMFRALTPKYASPEQIKGELITTATDVYSLGVVLYELLTGESPYGEASTISEDTIRAICDTEPVRPSAAVRSRKFRNRKETSVSPGKSHAMIAPEKLAKQLRGDLDNIVLMALRKEPQRRYSSVEQFAEDIRRSQLNLPIIARKDTGRYRAAKFIVRHKAGVAAVTAVALILIAGIVTTTRQARIAQQRFNDVRGLANSLIFDVHDSVRDLPGSTPARKLIVERALKYLAVLSQQSAGDLGLQRELAGAYERLGSVQGDYLENNLGEADATLASYRKALGFRQQIAAASKDWNDRLALAQGYRLVAHQLWANGNPRRAREPIGKAIEICSALNAARPEEMKILSELAFEYEVSGRIGYPDDPAQNQKIVQDYRRALAVDEIAAKIAPDDIQTLHGYSTDLSDIGNMLEATDPADALRHYQKGLEIDQKIARLSNEVRFQRSVAVSYGNIASVYDDLGDYAHAVENNERDLAIYKDLIRTDPQNVLLRQGLAITYINTAASLTRAGDIRIALADSKNGLEIMSAVVASAPEKAFQRGIYAAMLVIHGTILTAANQPDAAIPEIQRARSIYESLVKTGAKNDSSIAACEVKLGEAEAKAGRDQKAADHFQKALQITQPLVSMHPPDLDALYMNADANSALADINARKARQRNMTQQQRQLAWTQARTYYSASLNAWHRIEHPNHTAPSSFQVGDPITVAKHLSVAEVALGQLSLAP